MATSLILDVAEAKDPAYNGHRDEFDGAVLLKEQPKSELLWTPADDSTGKLMASPGWRTT